MDRAILDYNAAQSSNDRRISELLANEIERGLPSAEGKVWHGGPVWFIESNPVVGYWVRKNRVQLLFWSGQSFDEPALKPEGKFKAAEASFTSPEQVDIVDLRRWLEKCRDIQWDYKNIVKRKGKLVRLK
jgi:hypothetical protein